MKNSEDIKRTIAQLLSEASVIPVKIESLAPVSGGCINDCFEVLTTQGKFFLKRNSAKKYPFMFESEVMGLNLLGSAIRSITPKIRVQKTDPEDSWLIMEWITPGKPAAGFWSQFSQQLSQIHQNSSATFGLDHDNYIGSLIQENQQLDDWHSFFILRRVEPQLKKAVDSRKLDREIHLKFERLFRRLSDFFPIEKPALLHGDLWSGNYLIGEDGKVRLIDPAVYYGHREMDISMTKLFGGFNHAFYDAYQDYFPLEKGFENRMQVQQLYPLLVHTNLFGGHYATEVAQIIKRYG